MVRILKKLIVPSIIVLLFAFAYFIIIPYMQRRAIKENVFKSFEQKMTSLNIKYQKKQIDADEFGAWSAYSYVVGDKRVDLYVFNKDSKKYKSALKNHTIVSSKDSEKQLNGIFVGYCAIYVDNDFPNESEILNSFIVIATDYENKL